MNTDEVQCEAANRLSEQSTSWSVVQTMLATPLFVFAVDLLLGGLAYGAAWLSRIYIALPFTADLLPQERWDAVDHFWLLLIFSQGFFLYIFGLYDDPRGMRYREFVAHLFLACSLQVVTIAFVFYMTNGIFPRSVIALFGFLNFLVLAGWRSVLKGRLQIEVRRVLVIGESLSSASELVSEISKNPWMGLQVVGMAVGGEQTPAGDLPCPVLGTAGQTQEIVTNYRIDEIVIASQPTWKDQVFDSVSLLQVRQPVRIAILPSVYEIAIGRLRHINVHDTPLIEVRRNPNDPIQRIMKRTFDLFFAFAGLILLSPVLIFVSILIPLDSRGGAFYVQKRVGKGGKIFPLIKFRTMIQDAEKQSGEVYAEQHDPRVTRVGAILRRFRLDELPQMFNVLRGDMSFVGPRPERPGFVKKFSEELSGYGERHKVKPGMTGLAQVRGYYDTAAENKLKYDLAYIYNYSFSLDLFILLETIKVVLTRRGS